MNIWIVILLILAISSCFLYPKIDIKYYGHITNQSKIAINKVLQIIPDKYFENIHYIKVFEQTNYGGILGLYWWNNGIELYEGNDDIMVGDALLHEFSHNCQRIKGDSLYTSVNHLGNFTNCHKEVIKLYEDTFN